MRVFVAGLIPRQWSLTRQRLWISSTGGVGAPALPSIDLASRLEELQNLKDKELITLEEYESLRRKELGL